MSVLTAALVLSVAPAVASPAATKRAEAQRIKQHVDELDARVELAAEAYNEARVKHASLVEQTRQAQQRMDEADARIGVLQTHLSTRAETMYRNGPLSFIEVLLDAEDFRTFAATWDIMRDLNVRDSGMVVQVKDIREEALAAREEFTAKQAEAKQQLDVMASNKKSVENQLAERQRMLSGLESEIAAIEAADAARARANAAARSNAQPSRSGSGSGSARSFPPPTRAARGEVVNIAKRYLGAPYRWGASGPNSFDCSGFTMFVYRQVGVSLPHSSRAQYGSGERVSRDNLQPGDLVFFGRPIRHVGIYVGGNQYIHSPRTGDVVKISAMTRSDYVGAVRP